MKKFLSIVLAVSLIVMIFLPAVYADNNSLKFNEDGKFRIVHLTDVQDSYPMNLTTKQFIKEMLVELKPDIVVLGGDNTVSGSEVKAESIEELTSLFVENKTYFTLVFGNHDHQQMFDENMPKAPQVDGIKERLLSMYQQYGGNYCLAYDADPSLFGVGTHNLPIYSSDGSKVAFNLYMMDSNGYYPNEDGDKGYDAVHTDEIEWYEKTAAQLRTSNDGKPVPSFMFQHIIVQEIYDELFIPSPFSWGDIGEDFEGVNKEGIYHFTYLPKIANMESGFLFEKPCPGYYNYGQLDSLVKTGDVLAVFSGHDHTNDFSVNINGIDIVNSAGCTYHSYGSNLNRGVRVIDLDEKDLSTYTTYTYTIAEQALKDDSKITDQGDISKFVAGLSLFGIKFLNALMSVLKIVFFFVK